MTAATEFNPVSLLERIKTAENIEELARLNVEGVGYEFATDKTRRKWARATATRQKELSQVTKKPKRGKKG